MVSVLSLNKHVSSVHHSLNSKSVSPMNFYTLGSISIILLHNRLGHPSKHVIHIMLKNKHMASECDNKQIVEFCDACQLGKLHKFHFSTAEIKSKYPLKLTHTNIWSPT